MPQATGIGGVFLRARDPKALYAWYEKHLGLAASQGFISIPAEHERAKITLAFFSEKSAYFPVAQPAMINLQVDDLDALLTKLASDGVTVDPKRDSYDFGKFGWITDPEGNRVELWQPADSPAKA
ncbi:MAG TPA: VOC family protein [Acidobacteriaceae bacterium]|nr:VOC family protein [Acidobacteriaceae bacterium]